MICTLFTGQTSKEGFLCVIVMNLKENVLKFIIMGNIQIRLTGLKIVLSMIQYVSGFEFQKAVEEYIDYYNNKRIQAKTKWMPPVMYRKASMCST